LRTGFKPVMHMPFCRPVLAGGAHGLPLGARLPYQLSMTPAQMTFTMPPSSGPKMLTKRADFVAANRGLRNAKPGFVLLTLPNKGLGKRMGVTVTKKIGNAVVRNRMKRRFRELLRSALPERGLNDHDHVLIGRAGGVERDFHTMASELDRALARAQQGKGDAPRGHSRKSRPRNRKTKEAPRP